MGAVRLELEKNEFNNLGRYAQLSSNSKGRRFDNSQDNWRTCFQRDRDRILYSSAFKRLQYKTQVFVVHEGDFYRTRLTHTLEVVQHSRTLARILKLNEDLCEAIALAHDIGHAPFGHGGEKKLNDLMKDYGGFEHNIQSLRIVDELETRYAGHLGLDLTWETREGIARHETEYDSPRLPKEFQTCGFPTAEAQLVNLSDPLAFAAHDLEDALSANFIVLDELDAIGGNFWKEIRRKASKSVSESIFPNRSKSQIECRLVVRNLIEILTIEAVAESKKRLANLTSLSDVRNSKQRVISLPADIDEEIKSIKNILFEKVYHSPQVLIMVEKGKHIIKKLFQQFLNNTKLLPQAEQNRIKSLVDNGNCLDSSKHRVICDYIAGMTDRYAMDLFKMMFEPYEKVMFSFYSE